MITALRFHASWCNPCRISAPIFEQFTQDNGIPTVDLDIDVSPGAAEKFSVQSIPTVVFLKDHEEVARLVGPQTSAQLNRAYNNL